MSASTVVALVGGLAITEVVLRVAKKAAPVIEPRFAGIREKFAIRKYERDEKRCEKRLMKAYQKLVDAQNECDEAQEAYTHLWASTFEDEGIEVDEMQLPQNEGEEG